MPQVLELAASKVADFTVFGHVGVSIGGLATGTPGLKALLNQGDLRQKLADARAL